MGIRGTKWGVRPAPIEEERNMETREIKSWKELAMAVTELDKRVTENNALIKELVTEQRTRFDELAMALTRLSESCGRKEEA